MNSVTYALERKTQTNSMKFEEIYQEYGERVLNLAYRYTANSEVARDLTQDVFIKVYQNIAGFQNRSQLYTWIYKITTNHCLNYLKRERKRRWLSLLDQKISEVLKSGTIEESARLIQNPPTPDQILEKSQREKIIRKMINSIPLKYRFPLILQRYEGLAIQEIAEALSLTVPATETRIHRAKKLLIKKLHPYIDQL
jgi:RNA polymerase sigma-70 factor (ECF subfamily)